MAMAMNNGCDIPDAFSNNLTHFCGVGLQGESRPDHGLRVCCNDEPMVYDNCFQYCKPNDAFDFAHCVTHAIDDGNNRNPGVCNYSSGAGITKSPALWKVAGVAMLLFSAAALF